MTSKFELPYIHVDDDEREEAVIALYKGLQAGRRVLQLPYIDDAKKKLVWEECMKGKAQVDEFYEHKRKILSEEARASALSARLVKALEEEGQAKLDSLKLEHQIKEMEFKCKETDMQIQRDRTQLYNLMKKENELEKKISHLKEQNAKREVERVEKLQSAREKLLIITEKIDQTEIMKRMREENKAIENWSQQLKELDLKKAELEAQLDEVQRNLETEEEEPLRDFMVRLASVATKHNKLVKRVEEMSDKLQAMEEEERNSGVISDEDLESETVFQYMALSHLPQQLPAASMDIEGGEVERKEEQSSGLDMQKRKEEEDMDVDDESEYESSSSDESIVTQVESGEEEEGEGNGENIREISTAKAQVDIGSAKTQGPAVAATNRLLNISFYNYSGIDSVGGTTAFLKSLEVSKNQQQLHASASPITVTTVFSITSTCVPTTSITDTLTSVSSPIFNLPSSLTQESLNLSSSSLSAMLSSQASSMFNLSNRGDNGAISSLNMDSSQALPDLSAINMPPTEGGGGILDFLNAIPVVSAAASDKFNFGIPVVGVANSDLFIDTQESPNSGENGGGGHFL